MSLVKQRKIDVECRIFNDNWTFNLCDQLKSKLDNCTYLALALDESRDITDTSQFLIFIRGISKRFEITEELLSIYPNILIC